MHRFAPLVCLIMASFWVHACSGGPASEMWGEYTDEAGIGATLTIDAKELRLSAGPLSLGATYSIVGVDGDTVTARLAYADVSRTDEITIKVLPGGVELGGGDSNFRGKFKRK
jgi:hypothetical protein